MKPQKPPTAIPRVLPLKRAAAESGFNYWSLRDAFFRGELAIVKVGRKWFVRIEELERFTEAQTERRRVS